MIFEMDKLRIKRRKQVFKFITFVETFITFDNHSIYYINSR